MSKRMMFVSALAAATLAASAGWAGTSESATKDSTKTTTKTEIRIDRNFAFDVGKDCRYEAKVNGTLQPVQSKGAETRYRPDLDVWAKLSCPSTTAVEDTDGIRSDETFTREDLARMISFRASFFRAEGSKKCAYVPEVDFDGKDVKANKVSDLCPAPTATGGGPR